MMKLIFVIITALFFLNVHAQKDWLKKKDSLMQVLSTQKEDSNKANTLIYLGLHYLYNKPDTANKYLLQLYDLSHAINYNRGMVNSLSLRATILSEKGDPYGAVSLDSQALVVAANGNNLKGLASTYNNLAVVYCNVIGDYTLSLKNYLKSAEIYELLKDNYSISLIWSNMAYVYYQMKVYHKAIDYALKGIQLGNAENNPDGIEMGLINLGSSLVALKKYDTALIILSQAKDITLKLNDIQILAKVYNDYCIAFEKMGKYDSLKKYASTLLETSKRNNIISGISAGLGKMSTYHLIMKNYTKAYDLNAQRIQIARLNNRTEDLRESYKMAFQLDLIMGNTDRAFNNDRPIYDSLENLSLNDKIIKATQELETKYDLNKKDLEINSLNNEHEIQELKLRQRRIINLALGASVLGLLLLAWLIRKNSLQKQRALVTEAQLHQNRISELEKEKQLLAAASLLKGQEEERTRLAKDLHDGLGGILSSTKYSFNNMKQHLIITEENANAFEKSMNMLDKSISELRRVAHNMMPEALTKFGLETALKDFFYSINQSGALKIIFQPFDLDEATIPQTNASAVYRIVQELVNNILKHANATMALVQLMRNNNALSITVEDNGEGFDTQNLKNNSGMGYQNLANRIDYLKGSMDVASSSKSGTSINIEIPNICQ